MIWELKIEDAAMNRMPPEELRDLIEGECDKLEMTVITQINQGRKSLGLEVIELGPREQPQQLKQGDGDQ